MKRCTEKVHCAVQRQTDPKEQDAIDIQTCVALEIFRSGLGRGGQLPATEKSLSFLRIG